MYSAIWFQIIYASCENFKGSQKIGHNSRTMYINLFQKKYWHWNLIDNKTEYVVQSYAALSKK